jgi:Zn-dependent peptidase ImmA (M78 family)/transcriptional regulator with XRE-family HTH domain
MNNSDNVVRLRPAALDHHQARRLIPARLIEGRQASGMNQSELAAKVGVSRQAVSSYEQGDKAPEPETMMALAKALGQPISFFVTEIPSSFGPLSVNFFRKTGADTKRRNMACDVYARWLAQAAFTFESVANFPAVTIPSFEPKSTDTNRYDDEEIEDIAESVRQHFGLGLGPISNVVRLMESVGVIMCRLEMEGESVGAFSFWSGPRPFVFLASDKDSGARARYDAAHELGHLVLHRWVGADEIEDKDRLKEIEREADRFAGAFLLPRKSFPNEVYSPRLGAFVELKKRWKVSIQAMIYRCKNLGLFDEQQVTNLYKQISFKKWRKNEPLDGPSGLPLESPILLRKIASLVVDSGRMHVDEIKIALGYSTGVIERLLGLPIGALAQGGEIDFRPSLK